MRTSAFTSVTEEVLQASLGPKWHSSKPRSLDFSKPTFHLRTLEGPEGGLLNSRLDKSQLEELNLSFNVLSDVSRYFLRGAGFGRLRVLNLSQNQISLVQLELPYLVKLDLSHNCLTSVFNFSHLKALEMLIRDLQQGCSGLQGIRGTARCKHYR
eukprot:GHVU01022084.1.p1 GENE.GHVU01022084.1~~GHVU01022084.1.p1  ORF type:complete len:155 (-),score=19.07 GHVU01022084.1:410-874(-)